MKWLYNDCDKSGNKMVDDIIEVNRMKFYLEDGGKVDRLNELYERNVLGNIVL